MKINRVIWFCCAVPIAAMVCPGNDTVQSVTKTKAPLSVTPTLPKSPANKSNDAGNLPVIGHLETRDKTVTLQSGPNGLRYLVKTKDGKVLHENLSEDQLKAEAPEIHELMKTSVAGGTSRDGAFMDARVSGRLK